MIVEVLKMNWKQFIGFHSFEAAYLAVLAVLPFLVNLKFVANILMLFLAALVASRLWKRFRYKAIKVEEQGVVITGCDTGFGHALAKRLDSLGFIVIAGCLDKNSEGANILRKWNNSGRMHVVPLDVTDAESISNVVTYTKKACMKGVWAVVNNAAVNFVGDIEFCTMAQYQKIVDVNQFGMVRMTKAFLPYIRESKGRIINVTSAKGQISLPSNSVYGMTKYAAEAFSDVLRLEMMKFGVKVIVVEPGDFGGTTGMLSSRTLKWLRSEMDTMWESASEEVKACYGKDYFEAIYTNTVAASKEASTTVAPVIDTMEDAVINMRPKIRYLVDGSSKLIDLNNWFIRMKTFLPDSCMDWLLDRKYNSALLPIPARKSQ